MRAEIEAQMDTNGDGVVDEDERLDAMLASPMGRRILERFDSNGDGILDEAERQAMREEEARRRAEQEARMLERWDRDGDGVLSRQERDFYRSVFDAIKGEQWSRVQSLLADDKDGPLHHVAVAEFYLAANSPKVELPQIQEWLADPVALKAYQDARRLLDARAACERRAS